MDWLLTNIARSDFWLLKAVDCFFFSYVVLGFREITGEIAFLSIVHTYLHKPLFWHEWRSNTYAGLVALLLSLIKTEEIAPSLKKLLTCTVLYEIKVFNYRSKEE